MSASGFFKIFCICLFTFLITSCLGIGTTIKPEESLTPIPYDRAFDLALKSAVDMISDCKSINVYNFPVLVETGTSKSRGVITIHYKYDPSAGNICSPPPESIKILTSRFVPHFGAEYYMHVRFIQTENIAKGVSIEITQWKGVKKREFIDEMERLKEIYLTYLKRNWR